MEIPYDYEHIRSSEELCMQYCERLTDEEIALVVNCPENVGVTMRAINQSKGKMRIETWLADLLNVSKHGINVKLALQHTKLADLGIARTVKEVCGCLGFVWLCLFRISLVLVVRDF